MKILLLFFIYFAQCQFQNKMIYLTNQVIKSTKNQNEAESLGKYVKYLESKENGNKKKTLEELVFGNASPVDHPTMILLGGGTSSGKSTLKPLLVDLGIISFNHVSIDQDEVLVNLEEWKEISETNKCAASLLHEKSSEISKGFYTKAVKEKYNIIYSTTMKNYDFLMQRIPKENYKVIVVGAIANVTLAIQRSVERAELTNRWVPFDVMVGTHVGFSKSFPKFGATFPSFIYSMFNFQPKLVLKEKEIENWKLFSEFIDQRDLTFEEVQKNLDQKTLYKIYDHDRDCLMSSLSIKKEHMTYYYIGMGLIVISLAGVIITIIYMMKRSSEILSKRKVSIDDQLQL